MMQKIKNYLNLFLDLLFPKVCLCCGKEGSYLCAGCFTKLKIYHYKKTDKEDRSQPLDRLLVMSDYQDEIIKSIIHSLKYRFATDLKEIIFRITEKYLSDDINARFLDHIIIPIPLHKKRLRYRGFNQSEIIACEINKLIGGELMRHALIRQKYTEPQVSLKAKDRKKNLKNAFCLGKRLEISGKSVILVDDVYTTGSTMNEAAKILKKAGAKKIIGLVIAKG